eukprot:2333686-Amphidinium_carterae.1
MFDADHGELFAGLTDIKVLAPETTALPVSTNTIIAGSSCAADVQEILEEDGAFLRRDPPDQLTVAANSYLHFSDVMATIWALTRVGTSHQIKLGVGKAVGRSPSVPAVADTLGWQFPVSSISLI